MKARHGARPHAPREPPTQIHSGTTCQCPSSRQAGHSHCTTHTCLETSHHPTATTTPTSSTHHQPNIHSNPGTHRRSCHGPPHTRKLKKNTNTMLGAPRCAQSFPDGGSPHRHRRSPEPPGRWVALPRSRHIPSNNNPLHQPTHHLLPRGPQYSARLHDACNVASPTWRGSSKPSARASLPPLPSRPRSNLHDQSGLRPPTPGRHSVPDPPGSGAVTRALP